MLTAAYKELRVLAFKNSSAISDLERANGSVDCAATIDAAAAELNVCLIERQKQKSQRSIIFIGHGLGAMVIQQSLLIDNNSTHVSVGMTTAAVTSQATANDSDPKESILGSIAGVILLSSPILSFLPRLSQGDEIIPLLHGAENNVESLEHLNDFLRLVNEKEIPMTYFYEPPLGSDKLGFEVRSLSKQHQSNANLKVDS